MKRKDAENIFLTASEMQEESNTLRGNSVNVCMLPQSPAKTGGYVMRDNM